MHPCIGDRAVRPPRRSAPLDDGARQHAPHHVPRLPQGQQRADRQGDQAPDEGEDAPELEVAPGEHACNAKLASPSAGRMML